MRSKCQLTEPAAVFAGTLATKIVLLPPRDPESKGVVERRNGFFETSFMPGRHFESPADFNDQFTDWLTTANARVVRTTKARPVDLLAAEDLPEVREELLRRLQWEGPWFEVSAATGAGTEKLGQAVMRRLAAMAEAEAGVS